MENKHITLAYRMEAIDEKGHSEVVEEVSAEHPHQFISGFGVVLSAFEDNLVNLNDGDAFDFTLSPDEAYGPYSDEHVIELNKSDFCVNGRFDTTKFYEGAEVPLVNEEGMRFMGRIVKITDEKVTMDMNDELAGKSLRFVGTVISSRPATNREIEGFVNMISGEHHCCGCGCDHEHDDDHECCHGEKHHHDGEHECCHGHHHHEDGEHECCHGHHHHEDGKHECCHGHHHHD